MNFPDKEIFGLFRTLFQTPSQDEYEIYRRIFISSRLSRDPEKLDGEDARTSLLSIKPGSSRILSGLGHAIRHPDFEKSFFSSIFPFIVNHAFKLFELFPDGTEE